MKYEEFAVRYEQLKAEFEVLHGRNPKTVKEFDDFLKRKKMGKTTATTLKSLKGFSL